jgi:hypothetical protein
MQRRLAAYLDEMHQKQNKLSRQHTELQAAYEEALDYEEKKAKFLHKMTERMAMPVELLRQSTEAICRDYPDLSKTEMLTLQSDIMQGCETITELLDRLIKDPAGS